MSKIEIELYVIRNSAGQWFRAKGLNGSGNTWVDSLKDARIYTRIGPARGTVTFFSNNPKYPDPELIRLDVRDLLIINDSVHTKKAKTVKARKDLKRQMFR